tara:strand:- start:24 stop:1979 length:1956 start_codon:yes stop_codon:yes gene_type:complete
MCGIAGILNFSENHSNNLMFIQKITNTIKHRGPDDFNIYSNQEQGIYFGHTRLSIIDLSNNGSQPMVSFNKRYVMSFNGEIYNHEKLRNNINEYLLNKTQYINWNGHSDTETLVNYFEIFGIDKTLEDIEGMFAIALWDTKKRNLYLFRDFFGEKPLYYGWIGKNFIFGSELKTITAHPLFIKKIDENGKNLYLNLNYIPAPYTIYKDIFKLPPASYLKISNKNNHIKYQIDLKNWSEKKNIIDSSIEKINFDSLDKNTTILKNKLLNTVSKYMISDVEIGVFLSSGIDSTLITAITNEISTKPIKTFTIGFEDRRYDESEDAKLIANYLNTDHREKIFNKKDLLDIVPKLPHIYDEPYADSSQLPTFLLSSLASKEVKVALSGDGGDELFGGYNRYILSQKYLSLLMSFPKFSKIIFSNAIKYIPKDFYFMIEKLINIFREKNKVYIYEKSNKISSKLNFTENAYTFYLSLVSEWYGNEITKNQDKILNDFYAPNDFENLNNEEIMMYMDTLTYLPDDILCKVDRASMWHGLETRIPYLDKNIYKFSWSIPHHHKIKNGKGKIILRNLLKNYIPEKLILKGKKGFGIPIGDLIKSELRDWSENLLQKDKLINNNLNNDKIDKIWKEHLSGNFNHQHKLWNLLMFQSFFEN